MDCVHDFKRHGFCACDRLKVKSNGFRLYMALLALYPMAWT